MWMKGTSILDELHFVKHWSVPVIKQARELRRQVPCSF